jgi:hypothetical protein
VPPRPPRDLKRRTATRPERRTIVVFCEGEASEPDYIRTLKRLPNVRRNTSVTIEIDPEHGVPMTLVQAAIERRHDGEVDECWCLFDVEWPRHHPNLRRAVDLAAQHGIEVAISNPCFELWLILHYEDQTAFMDTKAAERRSRQLDGRAGKQIDGTSYMERRKEAAGRAAALAERHAGNETTFPKDNPSSTMYRLLAAIEPTGPGS